MAEPSTLAGRGSGFRAGLASARERRIQDEEIRRRREREDLALEAARYDLERARVDDPRRREREDLALETARYGLNRARTDDPRRRAREDLDYQAAELTLERARRADAREPEELRRQREREDLALDSARFSLENARTTASRAATEYEQQQTDRARSIEQQGLSDLAYALRNGVDPAFAARRFNERGGPQLREVQYDPATGRTRIVDSDGDEFNGTLDEFEAAVGLRRDEKAPIKLGENDRLIDPTTYKELVPAVSGGADAEGNTGAGSGRRVSPYNPETVQNNIRAGIMRSRGGQMDVLGNWSIANPEDRQIVDYMDALGQDMEGRLRAHVMAGKITPAEIVNAVTEATRDYPTESELAREAEAWRTKGFNKTQEDAAKWLETERAKRRAQVEAKLAEAEQRMLGNAAAPERPSLVKPPEWAGAEIPTGMLGGAQLEPGYEYDVVLDGRNTTLRVGPDGKVYEVKGAEPQAAPPPKGRASEPPPSAAATPTAAVTPAAERRPAGGFEVAEDAPLLSPFVGEAGRSVANVVGTAAGSVAAAGRKVAASAPRGAAEIAPVATRVVAQLRSGGRPARRDISALAAASDEALAFHGLTPEQIDQIRVVGTLADAKRSREPFTY